MTRAGGGVTGLVNIMGGAINATRARREQFPPMRVLERERPSHPDQIAFREDWERSRMTDRERRIQHADADAFIARMQQATRAGRERAERLTRVPSDIEEQIAAYAARKRRESGAGGES